MLNNPDFVPARLIYEFDEESEKLADRISKAALLKAKEMEMETVVETRKVLCFDIYDYRDNRGGQEFIHLSDADMGAKKNGISLDSFVKDVLPVHMKKAGEIRIKYTFMTSGTSSYKKKIYLAITTTAKDSSVEYMVEVGN